MDGAQGGAPVAVAGGGTPVAEAHGVVKRFGATVALADGGLTVLPGEVHALVGRNGAGKSTLVSILTGLLAPDAGTVRFGGLPAPRLEDRLAWRRAVACVYQRSTIVPDLTVAENLFLNRQAERGRIRWGALRLRAAELLERWDVRVDPGSPARDLKVEQRQLVEIARSLDLGSRFVVLDEPTAQLEGPAVQRLFARIRGLRDQGVTFLFISHHLGEVFDLCQRVTVFRDARRVLEADVASITRDDLVAAMTGDAARTAGPAVDDDVRIDRDGVPALRLAGVGAAGEVAGVSLDVARGEVVGVAGIGGSGKVALAEAVAGLRDRSGSVEVAGRAVRARDVRAALRAGMGYVPQDRHREGLVPRLSIAENATMTILERLASAGRIDRRRQVDVARTMMERLAVKAEGPHQPVEALSGGNAQKVVLARALANDPVALVLVNPTAGVDVRSKESLLASVRAAAGGGTGVLLVSDELEDLRLCDRVVVLFEGGVRGELPRGWSDHELVAATEGVLP